MQLTVDTVMKKGRLVADDDRYRIHDYNLDDLTVSVTELKRGKETRGHFHSSNAEVYFFPGGNALIEVGNEKFEVGRGAVLIPKGEFHRVVNKSKRDLLFVSVFPGKREHTRARYDRSASGSRTHRAGSSARAQR